jgi:hypothetical protein
MTHDAEEDDADWADYFHGAVPPGVIFDGQVDDLRGLAVGTSPEVMTTSSVVEISLIGLVAYFEAFCKGHFAALINIYPPLLRRFEARGREVNLRAVDLLNLGEPVISRIGFLVAERYDFGTPKSINSLFTDLLQRTPFSRDEADIFDRILDDRHLLVHHGGIYNPRYSSERFVPREVERSRMFVDSLVVSHAEFIKAASFLDTMSQKVRISTTQALRDIAEPEGMNPAARKALECITWTLREP